MKRSDTIPDQATIAIPNDPVNMSRVLLLLESMGLIDLTPGVASKASVADIVSNPKGLKVVPMEGAQSARSFDDVTASVTYTRFAKHTGLNVKDGLEFSNQTPENIQRYAIRWVTTPKRANDYRLFMFIRIYQKSVWVKSLLRAQYGELIDFPW